LTKKSWK